MEWKKAKYLILSMLLAVNLFLFFNIAVKYSRAAATERGEVQNALSLCSGMDGFTEEAFSDLPVYLYSYSAQRSVSLERAIASRLLSEDAVFSEAGGGVYIYSSGEGRVLFRRAGGIEGSAPYSDDKYIKHISSVFKKSGIKNKAESSGISFSYKGYSISNAGVTASRDAGVLTFSGTLPGGTGWLRDTRSRSRSELILALSGHIKNGGLGNLLGISVSYYLSSSGAQDMKLIPAITAECENGNVIMSMTDKSVIYSGN